jgi:hypothetical protein
MKRLDYLQQKFPPSLHRMGMLEGSEILVCSISHTFASSTQSHGGQKRPGKSRETQNWIGGTRPGIADLFPQPQLGHSYATNTLQAYTHASGSAQRRAVNRLEDHLFPNVPKLGILGKEQKL